MKQRLRVFFFCDKTINQLRTWAKTESNEEIYKELVDTKRDRYNYFNFTDETANWILKIRKLKGVSK